MGEPFGVPSYSFETSLGGYLKTLREKILRMKQSEVAQHIYRNRSTIERIEKNDYRTPSIVRGYTAFIASLSVVVIEEKIGELDRLAFLSQINQALTDFYRGLDLPNEKTPPSFHTWEALEQCAENYLSENKKNQRAMPSRPPAQDKAIRYYIPRLEDISEFVGREDDLAYFRQQLETTRLAFISGEFGIGKTFLATRLATELSASARKLFWHSFEYDQSFENLIEQLSRFLLANKSDALRRAWQHDATRTPDYLMEVALQTLDGQAYVLCLDDFHLAEGNPTVQEFTRRLIADLTKRNAYLLITSRHVPPLEWHVSNRPLDGLRYPDVYALFQQRGLPLPTPEQMRTLHATTQGHAYLISLTATLLQINPQYSEEIIAHLEHTDDIRRYLLREVFDRLDIPQRAVMNALSILNEPATREEIEIVTGTDGIRTAIARLSDWHLLKFDSTLITNRTYWLRPFVRNFFYDLLDTPVKCAMHRHAAELFEASDPLRAIAHYQKAGDIQKSVTLFPEIAEHDWEWIHTGRGNLLKTVLAAFQPEDFSTPMHWVRAQRGLGRVAMFHREVGIAQAHYQQGLETLKSLPASDETHFLALQIHLDWGEMLETTLPEDALTHIQKGHEHLRALPEGSETHREEELRLYNLMGRVQMERDDLDDAARFFRSALANLREFDTQPRIEALLNLGHILAWQGDAAEARRLYETARQVCETSGDDFRRISILVALGQDDLISGDWHAARHNLKEAETLAAVLGSVTQKIELWLTLGILYTRQGDFPAAEQALTSAVQKAQAAELHAHAVDALSSLADLYLRRGKFDDATQTIQTAFERGQISDYRPAELYRTQAQIFLHRGNLPQARQSARHALEQSHWDAIEEGLSWCVVAQIAAAEGDLQAAEELYRRSYDLLTKNAPWESAQTQTAWGRTLLATSPERARDLLQQARETFHRLGAAHDLTVVDAILRDLM